MTSRRPNSASFKLNSISRRDLLSRTALGFGSLAFCSLINEFSAAGESAPTRHSRRGPHFPPRAKRVIFLFMHGGPSHIDLFDPKPALAKYDGQPLPFKGSRVVFAERGNLMKSPWRFSRHGEAGLPMSELWQHLPAVADDLCMIHSVCETNVAHGGACMKLHTGDEALLRPSMGAWIGYGLGSETRDLPGFVTICPTSLHGGVNNFGAGFLPARYQGVPLGTPGYPNTVAKNARFEFVESSKWSAEQQSLQLELLRQLHALRYADDAIREKLDARLRSFELAFRMQAAAPEVMDVASESKATRELYGLDQQQTKNYGLQCLLARRLAERGVRFIQVSHAHTLPFNNEQWDQHSHLEKGHSINVGQIDKPITGLIKDLKARGMLDDTLVVWAGEFGRTPTVQKGNSEPGRDHHPEGFTIWMAGGGVRGGLRYGATDEFGYYATENRFTIHDLHATLLHLLGLDHERLTFRHDGRDFRLTDVHGVVARDIVS